MFNFFSIAMHRYKTCQSDPYYIQPSQKGKYHCYFHSLFVPYNNKMFGAVTIVCAHNTGSVLCTSSSKIMLTETESKWTTRLSAVYLSSKGQLKISDQEGLTQHICSHPS